MWSQIEEVDGMLNAAARPDLLMKDRGIGQRVEWRIDDLGDLRRIRLDMRRSLAKPAHERRHQEVAHRREDRLKRADSLDPRLIERQFLVRLTQRRHQERAIAWIARAAGERNLAAVPAQVRRAAGEEQIRMARERIE